MCGIAGIYNFGNNRKTEQYTIKKMCSLLKHRGPDDEGIYCKDNIGLGHRRLSIIDIEGGHQPMSNEDGTLWIVFNGEIYNFPEIKENLLKKGYRFKTKSDTEVILNLYEEEKESCLYKLNGMFAFAIWDEKRRELFLARDRIGIKPLHYFMGDGKLIFASEIKAILEDSSIKREIDFEALHDYLSFLYVPAPKTMFKGIKKLPAGHYLICSENKFEIKEYWDAEFTDSDDASEAVNCGEIYSRLKEAVKKRLISDVPLGAFLSGGIDSSSVVSLMSELQEEPVLTNSIGFSEKRYDEIRYAEILAKKYKTDHHEYIVEPKALEVLDKLLWFYDEPFGDASSIPTYYVSKMTRQNVKVALSGDGGDENFAGYNRYIYSNAIIKLQNLFPAFAKKAAKSISSRITHNSKSTWAIKIKNKLEEVYLSPLDIYFKIMSMYKEEEKSLLYSKATKDKLGGYSSKRIFQKFFENCKSENYISRLQYLDIKTYLCDDILTKVDRASMANSLEVRVPILDHTFVEYVATIPAGFKARGLKQKYIFKKAMSRNLPKEILHRSKMGFGVPMTEWLRGELKQPVENELFDKKGIIQELFNIEYVQKIWHRTLYSNIKSFRKTDFSYRIWLLFIFSRWYKRFISNE